MGALVRSRRPGARCPRDRGPPRAPRPDRNRVPPPDPRDPSRAPARSPPSCRRQSNGSSPAETRSTALSGFGVPTAPRSARYLSRARGGVCARAAAPGGYPISRPRFARAGGTFLRTNDKQACRPPPGAQAGDRRPRRDRPAPAPARPRAVAASSFASTSGRRAPVRLLAPNLAFRGRPPRGRRPAFWLTACRRPALQPVLRLPTPPSRRWLMALLPSDPFATRSSRP